MTVSHVSDRPRIGRPLNVIVATDCGSTTTKAILIEKVGDEYRQTYRGEAPTTVEAPFEDVTRGVLNLTHRDSHEHPKQLEPGRRYEVTVPLDVIAHSFPAGHRLRVAVSPAYWPWAWPSPEAVMLTLHGGRLDLPVREPRPEDDELRSFEEPEHSAALSIEEVAGDPGGRFLRKEHATGRVEQIFDWALGGSLRFVDIDLHSGDTSHCVYAIVEGDPLSAEVRFHAASDMGRGNWQTRSDVTSSMTCDAESFHVESELDVFENGEVIFTRSWSFAVPRDLV